MVNIIPNVSDICIESFLEIILEFDVITPLEKVSPNFTLYIKFVHELLAFDCVGLLAF